jgi:hypothetical protein
LSGRAVTCACWLLLAALVGCSQLPQIDADVCGNIVLESGEDCDGFASHALACRPPGTIGQCHMDCSPADDGSRVACPTGWGCDPDHVCRKVAGEYRALPERVLGNAWALSAGDFDGDGREDVLASARPSAFGITKFRVHRFDQDGALVQSWISSALLGTPTPFRTADGAHSDVAYARGGGVGVMSGEPNGTLLSAPLPSYFLEHTDARILPVLDDRIHDSAAVLVLASRNGVDGIYRQSQTSEHIELAAELPAGLDQLAAEPLYVYLREDRTRYPCRDVVLAYRGARELSIYAPCEINPFSGDVDWLDAPEAVSLALDPPAPISAGLLTADLDGDGHIDIMVGSEHGPYAAYGDGNSFGPLQPYDVIVVGRTAATAMPLAAGDLTGDGIAELVLPDAVVLADATLGARDLRYIDEFGVPGLSWTEALIADFNRDGHPDAVAASSHDVDIDFLNGTSSRALNPASITTDRPVEHIAVGDFDGDFFNDLAFVQRSTSPGALEEVSVAYGDSSGPPGPPVTIARLEDVRQISPFSAGTENAATHMALFYRLDGEDGERGSALALITASSDRALSSVIELSTFSEDAALSTAHAIAIALGAFLQPGQTDAISLALGLSLDGAESDELWLLPDINARRGNTLRLGWGFAGITPLYPADDSTLELAAAMAAGDLDGDGIDELLLSAPDSSGERCVLSSARIAPAEPNRLQLAAQVTLDQPCVRSVQLSAVDLDADGDQDVMLALGSEDARKLVVLWGDGSGKLNAERMSTLTPAGASVQAFTTFRTQAGAPLELAYTTVSEARRLRAGKDARSFEDGGQLIALEQGSGITTADVDGDGVSDLVVADEGALRVLHAELEAR